MPTHPQRPLVLKTLIQFTAKLRYAERTLLFYVCGTAATQPRLITAPYIRLFSMELLLRAQAELWQIPAEKF